MEDIVSKLLLRNERIRLDLYEKKKKKKTEKKKDHPQKVLLLI